MAGPHHTCLRRSARISIPIFLSVSMNSIHKRRTPPCSYGCHSRALCFLCVPARSGILLPRSPSRNCRWGHHQQLTPSFDTCSLGEEPYASSCCCRGFCLLVLAANTSFFRGAGFLCHFMPGLAVGAHDSGWCAWVLLIFIGCESYMRLDVLCVLFGRRSEFASAH